MAVTINLEPYRRNFFAHLQGIGAPCCWLWTDRPGRVPGRRGPLFVVTPGRRGNRRSMPAAEAALYFFRGRLLTRGEHVVHLCDREDCVRPDHLAIRSEVEDVRCL